MSDDLFASALPPDPPASGPAFTAREAAPTPVSFASWPGWGWLVPLLLGIGTLIVYLPHICPVLFVGDSGEFLTAAWTHGIAHPPGYPLYVVLLGWWIRLPWQSPSDWMPALFGSAYGGNCFSAVAAALTVAGVGRLGWHMGRHAGWALLAGCIWLATPTFFSQALIAEVYTFQALLIVLYLIALERLIDATQPLALIALLGLQGALLATHPMGLLWTPITLLAMLIYRLRKPTGPPGPWIAGMVAFGCLLSLYLSLPLRSIHDPWLDWANPDSWERFWAVIGRVEYKGIMEGFREGGIGARGQIEAWAQWTWGQYGWVVVPMLLGIILAARRGGPWVVLLSIAFVCWTVPFWIYFRHIPAGELPFLEVYYIPTHLLLLLLALSGFMPHPRAFQFQMPSWQSGIVALLVLGYVGNGWGATVANASRAESQIGARFAVTTLQSIPDRSVLIVEGDEIFLYWYLQAVAGMKPETAILEAAILSDTTSWYWQDLRRRHPDLAIPAVPSAGRFREMELESPPQKEAWMARDLARSNADRPLFLTGLAIDPGSDTFGMNWYGLLYELKAGEDLKLRVEPFYEQKLNPPGDVAWLLQQRSFDFYEVLLKAKYVRTLKLYGQQSLTRGKLTEAERLFAFLIQLDDEQWDVYSDLGKSLMVREDWEAAGEIFAKLTAHDPHDPLFPFALAVVHFHLGDLRAARIEAARAVALDPDNRLAKRESELIETLLQEQQLRKFFSPPPPTEEGSPSAPPSLDD